MDWTPALFGLAGTVVGAIASYAGSARLQRSSNREAHQRELEARENNRVAKRGEALHEWIDAMIEFAGTLPPYPDGVPSPAARTNRAQIAFSILLTNDEQPALDYVQGLVHSIASTTDVNARMGTINQGGQELVDWQRGVPTQNGFHAFEFVGYGPAGQIVIRTLDRWPFQEAPGAA